MQNGTYNSPKNYYFKKSFLYYKDKVHGLIKDILPCTLIFHISYSLFFYGEILYYGAHMIDHIPIAINCSIIN